MIPEELQLLLTAVATVLNAALGVNATRKVTAPEDAILAVVQAYTAATGKPIDPSIFTYEPPIEQG